MDAAPVETKGRLERLVAEPEAALVDLGRHAEVVVEADLEHGFKVAHAVPIGDVRKPRVMNTSILETLSIDPSGILAVGIPLDTVGTTEACRLRETLLQTKTQMESSGFVAHKESETVDKTFRNHPSTLAHDDQASGKSAATHLERLASFSRWRSSIDSVRG